MPAVRTDRELPTAGKKKYSFPVILGTNPGEPVSTRAARMRIYNDVVGQLDAGGAHRSEIAECREKEVFVSRHPRHQSGRARFHARRTHADLQRRRRPT